MGEPVEGLVHFASREEPAQLGRTGREQAGPVQLRAVGCAHLLIAGRVESVLEVDQVQEPAPYTCHLPVHEANPGGMVRAVREHILGGEVVMHQRYRLPG